MAVNQLHLCMGCMSPRFDTEKCSVCGYDVNTPHNIDYLPPARLLAQGRYLVGKLTAFDPEGAWYVGYDIQEETRVWVREYAPGNIIRRDHENFSIHPLASSEAQYKALMADFEDLSRSIMCLPQGEKVIPVLDVVHDNNTAYAIYRYIKTITLESFLLRSGGKLPWRHAKKLLMPLFHTVSNAHKAGLIHRGLSPQTVLLDQSGALWISAFCIAAARTNKSELSAQLFEGYAAPEQYSLNSWQGAWTDVYALGALTYRVVIGKNPPSALDRVYGDDLLDSRMISAEMTGKTIDAINQALAVEVEDRIQSAEMLISGLLANESSDTAVYTAPPRRSYETPDDQTRRQGIRVAAAPYEQSDRQSSRTGARFADYDAGIDLLLPDDPVGKAGAKRKTGKPEKIKQKKQHPVLMLTLSLLVATALLGGVMYWIVSTYLGDLVSPSSQSGKSENSVPLGSEFSEGEMSGDTVPRFVGATAESVKSNGKMQERYDIVFQEKFNDLYGVGVICEQLPLEGTKMPNRGQVTLVVSKGPEMVEMPEVVGKTIEEAMKELNDLELQVQVIEVLDKSYEPGIVERAEPAEPGKKINKQKDTVFLYIKKVTATDTASKEDTRDDKERSSSSEGRGRLKPKAQPKK